VSEPQQDREMTIMEHLEELRKRLMIVALGTVLGMAIAAAWLTVPAMKLLVQVAAVRIIYFDPTEGFTTYMKVTLAIGAAIAMPVIVSQVLLFVMPALHPHERRWVYIGTPAVTLAFCIGVLFAILVVAPAGVQFLAGFGSDIAEVSWGADKYLSFISSFVFWIGASFETPLIVFFLAKLGVVQVKQLARYRKYALIGAFVIGAFITPTPDPLNQTIVSLPLYLLYELGILLARFA
jgi:sec-independent protein translocase protein TatC